MTGAPIQLWLGAILVIGAIFALLWFLVGSRILGTKQEPGVASEGAASQGRKPNDPRVKDSNAKENLSVIDRTRDQFGEATTKRIEGVRFGRRLSRSLERAGSKLRPGEYVLAVMGITGFITLVVYFWRGTLSALLAAIIVVVGSRWRLKKKFTKRQDAFADQLPDFLQMLATTLRAGQSLNQAINSVSLEARTPTKEELQRVVIEQRIGRDLTASFKDLSDRMDSKDFEWVVAAIDINRTVGGDLAQILGRVESTIRARNKIRGQVAAMSAEGKLSGGVLVALPPGLLFVVSLINPGYLDPMFNTFYGQLALGVSATMLFVGAMWLRKISQFTF